MHSPAQPARRETRLCAIDGVPYNRYRRTAPCCRSSASTRLPPGRIPVKFRPLHDRVVIRRVVEIEKTAGGILIPDTAREKPTEGEVLAVGPGIRGDDGKIQALDVKSGDRVV